MGEAVNTDLTFFTNLPDSSLLDRFTSPLPEAQLFDVLVGYFRLSGFHQLREHLEDVEKIRTVQEENFELFDRIKRLPKKARSARALSREDSHDGLLSFFRNGNLKQYYLCTDDGPEQLSFYQAAILMECEKGNSGEELPEDYYERLNQNKQVFREVFKEEISSSRQGGQTNEQYIVQFLRILQNHIPDGLLEKEPPGSGRSDEPHEIILSSYRVSDTSSNPGDEG